MKSIQIKVVFFSILMLINSTNVEAQSKKKFCDVIKKV